MMPLSSRESCLTNWTQDPPRPLPPPLSYLDSLIFNLPPKKSGADFPICPEFAPRFVGFLGAC